MRATCRAHCITLNFNKLFSGQQPRQVVEWRVNRRFEDHFCPGDKNKGVPRNVGLLAIEPPVAAAGPKMFY